MSGICDTCQRNQVCGWSMDGMYSCRLYMSGKKSNYEKLFGTPERAARTLANIATDDGCEDCVLLDATCCRNDGAWLKWLRGDAE